MNASRTEVLFGFGRSEMAVACAVILASLPIAVPGCGPQDPRISVQGTVSLDGKPLPSGQVVFIPSGKTLGATGSAIEDGQFRILAYKGLSRVEINSVVLPGPPATDAAGGDPVAVREIIPQRYNEQSVLSVDVQSAEDKPAFHLRSGE